MKLIASLIVLLPATVLVGEDPDLNWTQWRGNGRDSVIKAAWPSELSSSNIKKLWSQPLGPSYSGPIVMNDIVFTTETRDKKDEVVFALDAKTGEQKWKTEWQGSMSVPFFARKNGSWIRSTPATDGERLFVAGILGRLVCIDINSGETVWDVDFSKRYGVQHEDFGHVCSPLIIDADESKDKYIYIQCNAGFLKMDRLTGKEVWRTLNEGGSIMSRGAFSSPFMATVAGKQQILVQTRTDLTGVDIESGKVLWKQPVPNFRGMNILTPTVYKDTVFTSSYNNRSFGYAVAQNGDGFSVSEKWTAPSKAYMSSPVVIGKNAFVHLQNKRIASFDLESGETNWISKKRFGDYWSMVSNGKRILALDSSGKLVLINADPKTFKIVGEAKLETDDAWAHLAISGDTIFVRGLKSLAAYQWQ